MGVSGVAQFKQGMKESQAAVKTLDQELKLNEQYLKTNGDAQTYMQKKTELLQQQIRMQTEVVNQAEKALDAMTKNGVRQSSTAFQNMQQQVVQAKTQLLAMQGELDGVGDAGSDAAGGLSEINYQLDRVQQNTSWENIANGIQNITSKMEAAGKAALTMGKRIVQAALSGGQWADDLQTTADQWEMTPEQVYRMRQTANLIDTDAETIFQARQKLIKAMGQQDNKETMGAFAALGINDLSGTGENIEDVFWNAGKALMGMEDTVDRNEYAMKLFGRSWTDLIPIFKAGREEYESTMKSWSWMGEDQFKSLTELNDEQMKLSAEWENFQHQFEASLAPALTSVMEILERLMHEFNVYLQSEDGQKMLNDLSEAVSSLFSDLQTIKPEEVMEKIKGALDSVKSGLEWLIQNKDSVVTALKVIAGGFAMMKIAEVAANIGRIVSGLKGLGGGGGGAQPTGGNVTGGVGATSALKNTITAATAKGASLFTQAGMLVPVLGDRLMNETNAGRALRDGGDFVEGIRTDFEEKKSEIERNASTFVEDWSNLFKNIGGALNRLAYGDERGYRTPEQILSETPLNGAQNAAVQNYWDALKDWNENRDLESMAAAQEQLTDAFQGQDGLLEAVKGMVLRIQEENANWTEMEDLPEAWDKFAETAETMNTESSKATTEMANAANGLQSLPGDLRVAVEGAIRTGMAGVTIVINEGAVDTIGRRVNGGMGQMLQMLVK
jgi:hypothetical protein